MWTITLSKFNSKYCLRSNKNVNIKSVNCTEVLNILEKDLQRFSEKCPLLFCSPLYTIYQNTNSKVWWKNWILRRSLNLWFWNYFNMFDGFTWTRIDQKIVFHQRLDELGPLDPAQGASDLPRFGNQLSQILISSLNPEVKLFVLFIFGSSNIENNFFLQDLKFC